MFLLKCVYKNSCFPDHTIIPVVFIQFFKSQTFDYQIFIDLLSPGMFKNICLAEELGMNQAVALFMII